jgi:hypothetical protein
MKQPAKDIRHRASLSTASKALNTVPPEIDAFHEAVELGPGLTADIY